MQMKTPGAIKDKIASLKGEIESIQRNLEQGKGDEEALLKSLRKAAAQKEILEWVLADEPTTSEEFITPKMSSYRR